MVKKLFVFAITSGLAAKFYKSYMAKKRSEVGSTAVDLTSRQRSPH